MCARQKNRAQMSKNSQPLCVGMPSSTLCVVPAPRKRGTQSVKARREGASAPCRIALRVETRRAGGVSPLLDFTSRAFGEPSSRHFEVALFAFPPRKGQQHISLGQRPRDCGPGKFPQAPKGRDTSGAERSLFRPYRASSIGLRLPRALPWAGMLVPLRGGMRNFKKRQRGVFTQEPSLALRVVMTRMRSDLPHQNFLPLLEKRANGAEWHPADQSQHGEVRRPNAGPSGR